MALGAILSAKKRLTAEQGHLEVVVPTPEIRRIFEITMLDRVFEIFDTPGAGVEHLQEVGAATASDVSPRR